MALEVIPLKCPTCTSPLSGFEKDQIFFCANCPSGWDFSEKKPKPLKLSYARARVKPENYQMIFYLPFYLYSLSLDLTLGGESVERSWKEEDGQRIIIQRVSISTTIQVSSGGQGTDSRISERVHQLMKELNRAYVSGFQLMRESYFGDLGLLYTEAKLELEEDPIRDGQGGRRIGSATRSLKEAEPYLKYYPLSIIDKRQDITGKELSVDFRFEQIWAVPFFDLGKQIQEGILGKTFPSFALEAIDEFRKMRY